MDSEQWLHLQMEKLRERKGLPSSPDRHTDVQTRLDDRHNLHRQSHRQPDSRRQSQKQRLVKELESSARSQQHPGALSSRDQMSLLTNLSSTNELSRHISPRDTLGQEEPFVGTNFAGFSPPRYERLPAGSKGTRSTSPGRYASSLSPGRTYPMRQPFPSETAYASLPKQQQEQHTDNYRSHQQQQQHQQQQHHRPQQQFSYARQRGRSPSASPRVVTGKPPTPPPYSRHSQDRSRTPPSSQRMWSPGSTTSTADDMPRDQFGVEEDLVRPSQVKQHQQQQRNQRQQQRRRQVAFSSGSRSLENEPPVWQHDYLQQDVGRGLQDDSYVCSERATSYPEYRDHVSVHEPRQQQRQRYTPQQHQQQHKQQRHKNVRITDDEEVLYTIDGEPQETLTGSSGSVLSSSWIRPSVSPSTSLGRQQSPKPIIKKAKTPPPEGSMTSSLPLLSSMLPEPMLAEMENEPYPRYIGNETVSNDPLIFYAQSNMGSRAPSIATLRPETPAFPVQVQGTDAQQSLDPEPEELEPIEEARIDEGGPTYQTILGQHSSQKPVDLALVPRSVGRRRRLNSRSPSPSRTPGGQLQYQSMSSISAPDAWVDTAEDSEFVQNTSNFWYKPDMSRQECVDLLKCGPPGRFIIRQSTSFPGSFGLALKVDRAPFDISQTSDDDSLVRHFLIEPTAHGVKLKGCDNEPVFGSLSALVYQHSLTPLALPCRLELPLFDPTAAPSDQSATIAALLTDGASCDVTYLHSSDVEALTGTGAIQRTIDQINFNQRISDKRRLGMSSHEKELVEVKPVTVHFKVSAAGITVTDIARRIFFRWHYPVNAVTYCGFDPQDRKWSHLPSDTQPQFPSNLIKHARMFGFVARRTGPTRRPHNVCHIFAELEKEQPGSAIVNFTTKIMMHKVPQEQEKEKQ